jgi:hypothetical protein
MAMARKLSAADLFDTLEVDLWGNNYTLREITRSVNDRLTEAQAKVDKLDDDSPGDEIAEAVIGVADVLLAPAGSDVPPAAEVLGKRWEADELGLDWLQAFAESLQEEAGARRRPTSATQKRT